MPLPIQVPGLDGLVRNVPDGHILLVEGGLDPSKSHFVQTLTRSARSVGRAAAYITSRSLADAQRAVDVQGAAGSLSVAEATLISDVDLDLSPGADLFVDSFSFLTLGLDDKYLATTLKRMRARCQEAGSVAVLATERGMMTPRQDAILSHLTDGVVQFHAREDNDGVVQYLRIPKWMTGEVFTRNIYYTFDGRRLLIDTRRRVV